MLIYKVKLRLKDGAKPSDIGKPTRRGGKIFLTDVGEDGLTLCQVAEWKEDAEAELNKWLERRHLSGRVTAREEIPVHQLAEALREGSENGLCPEPTDVLCRDGLIAVIGEPFCSGITEAQIERGPSAERALRMGGRLNSRKLTEELQRIADGAGGPFAGHPLLYAVCGMNGEQSEMMSGLLLAALRSAGRLPSNRICCVNANAGTYPEFMLRDLYRAQSGATVLVRIEKDAEDAEERAGVSANLRRIARLAHENRQSVLTVFELNDSSVTLIAPIMGTVDEPTLLFIRQDSLDREAAKKRLRAIAREHGVKPTASLTRNVPKDPATFTESELEEIFSHWYEQFLMKEAYPQYAAYLREAEERKIAERETEGSGAYERLAALVGLTEIKRVVAQIADYAKLRKLCVERGIPAGQIGFHMVFTGNPGTAKTTVARLTAQLLKESGVLPVGDLVEVGRGDLIGKYVGWTAQRVKERFDEAKGSVLFIDEAYSLLDDHENEFGDEALSTIVQEMENRRDDTVVILAGYPEPMKRLIERNAGLASRVSFRLDFPDYTEDELMDIFRGMLRESGRTATPEALEKVRGQLRDAMSQPDFGNGRYVRRMLEHAQLAQASRLMRRKERLSDEDVLCLTADDFCAEEKTDESQRVIGFAG